jgi:DHA1 family bicyclomycin/chloramphenicol resistance-like MFS transporter
VKTQPASWVVIAMVTAMTAISSASISQYLPSLPAISHELGASSAQVQLTLSVFVVTYALAQLVWGPLSDRYGRKPMLILGLVLYVAFSLAAALADTIGALIAFRVLQACAAACPPVIARAVVRDRYELKDAARVMAYVSASFSIAPVAGPIIGAALEEAFGWRANFLFMVAFGVVIAVAVTVLLPETRRPGRGPSPAFSVLGSYGDLISRRTFLGYALCICFGFACIFVFNSVAPFYFIGVRQLTPQEFSFAYAIVTLGYGSSSYLAAKVTPRLGIDRTILMGICISLGGAFAVVAAVTSGFAGIAGICGTLLLVGLGAGFIFPNAQAGAIAPFPEKAGAASALIGFMQMAFASLAGVLATAAYDGTANTLAFAVLILNLLLLASYLALVLPRARRQRLPRRD